VWLILAFCGDVCEFYRRLFTVFWSYFDNVGQQPQENSLSPQVAQNNSQSHTTSLLLFLHAWVKRKVREKRECKNSKTQSGCCPLSVPTRTPSAHNFSPNRRRVRAPATCGSHLCICVGQNKITSSLICFCLHSIMSPTYYQLIL
jgi:hypothetical protein